MQKNIIAISNDLYTDIFNDENFLLINNNNELTYEKLQEINPEYIFFPHWSYVIPANIYENFNCIIFHMTDLPFGRGGSPLQNLIARSIYSTKISAIKCVQELDAGDVYLKKDFDISCGSAKELYIEAGYIIKKMINEIILTKPKPQKQIGTVIEFKRRKPKDSNIEELKNTVEIFDYIRMLDAPGYPKAFLNTINFKFEFTDAVLEGDDVVAKVIIKGRNND